MKKDIGNLVKKDIARNQMTTEMADPEIVHDRQVSRKCYKISRNLGNLIDLLIFSANKHTFGVNPIGF